MAKNRSNFRRYYKKQLRKVGAPENQRKRIFRCFSQILRSRCSLGCFGLGEDEQSLMKWSIHRFYRTAMLFRKIVLQIFNGLSKRLFVFRFVLNEAPIKFPISPLNVKSETLNFRPLPEKHPTLVCHAVKSFRKDFYFQICVVGSGRVPHEL